MVQLLVEGINETKPREIPITIIYNEKEAIMHAYNTAKTGSLITIMCDVVSEALDLIKDMKEEAIPVLMKKINQEEAKDQDEITEDDNY